MPRPLCFAVVALAAAPLSAQPPQAPWRGENLQFFPKDIAWPGRRHRQRAHSRGAHR